MTPELAAALRDAAGGDALEEHEPVAVDGVGIGATLRPADADGLAAALAALHAARAGAVVRGGGTQLGLGNPPRDAGLFLSTERLAGVDVFEPGEGVCHAGAGTPLAQVQEKVAAQGWELPLDPPGARSTVGGVVATAVQGPRALAWGPVRDAVLGLDVALASGERTRCGGRVVKNVTGYDLAKLYVGSLGTLGVIEGAWLRLRPLAERSCVLEATQGAAGAEAAGLAAARLATARAAVLELGPGTEARLVAELAGGAAAVARDAAALAADLGAQEVPAQRLVEARARQASLGAEGLRFRLAVLPSRLGAVIERLLAAGAELVVHPGVTHVHAGFPLSEGEEPALARAAEQVAEAARDAGGGSVLEQAPAWAKRGRDVFSADAPTVALARSLKQRFDPHGVLNPGRFQGGL